MKKTLFFCSIFFLGNFTIQAQDIVPLAKTELTVEAENHNSQFAKPGISQTPIAPSFWGAGSGVGEDDGEFANAFVNATSFVSGDNPTSWTALSLYDNDGAVTPGNAYWVRNLTGYSAGAYWSGTTSIASPSAANGVALFDSDFFDNGGVPGAFGTGSSPSAHKGELISPRIDLSGYTDVPVAVGFYSFYREHLINELSVSISTDDGGTWTTVDYRNYQPSLAEGFVSIGFSSVTAGVANLTQCRIKFTFDGDYYFAIVDDVSISELQEYDLTIDFEDVNGNDLRSSENQLIITNNRHFPLSQMNTHHLLFGANVKNLGAEKVLASDNAMLNVEIQENQGGTWVGVHSQNTDIDTVDILVGTKVWDTLNTDSWAVVGDFRTRYVTVLASDDNANNDTVYHYFSINNSSYASKVSNDTDGKPLATRAVFPGGGPYNSLEYGSMFEFSNLTNNPLNVDSVSFRYFVPAAYSGPASTTLFVHIYKFEDGVNGSVIDGRLDANGNELNLLALSNITLSGIGTTVAPGDYGVGVASIFIDAVTGMAMDMSNLTDGNYLFSIMNNPSLTGGPVTFDANSSIWFGASEENSYGINAGMSTGGDVIAHSSPLKVVDGAGASQWFWLGFEPSFAASLGVHLSCESIQTTDVRTECTSFTWVDGIEYTSDNNSATHTFEGGAANGCDSIVTLDLTIINPTTGTDIRTECSGFTWIDGVEYVADNNTAMHTIIGGAANGCDSIVTLDLTITTVDITTNTTDSEIQSNVVGAAYQWLDCNDNMSEIDGETSQSYTASADGNYAVQITENGCVDTSACTEITTFGIDDNYGIQNVQVYPNPTAGDFTISIGGNVNSTEVVIYSAVGQVIVKKQINTNETVINLQDYSNGIYFIEIQNGENVMTTRIIKK